MIIPEKAVFETFAREYPRVPLGKEVLADLVTPIALLQMLEKTSAQFFLLESVIGGEQRGRYSFIGFDPILRVFCTDGLVTRLDYAIREAEPAPFFDFQKQKVISERQYRTTAPEEILRGILAEFRAPLLEELPAFAGGLVGYSAYAMFAYSEPSLSIKRNGTHDCDWMLFDRVIAYDHLLQKIFLIVNADSSLGEGAYVEALTRIEALEDFVYSALEKKNGKTRPRLNFPDAPPSETEQEFISEQSEADFCAMVEQGKNHIYEGDIFQVVLSRRFSKAAQGSLLDAYRLLRSSNPSPYMVYLKNDDEEVISTSPETLVKLDKGRLTTFPVAGSRPRGQNRAEDEALEVELLADEKELAEHNMLVDLGRNDLGRIAKPGSVSVTTYQTIHRYSRIMHICSQVEADLREGLDAFDALAAVLPAGTLSGAPKIRACQIIDALEVQPRGIYGGALGYVSLAGQMDSCIAIRMAHQKDGQIVVQAGAGIVADSVPKKEYVECGQKAAAVIAAIQAAASEEVQA